MAEQYTSSGRVYVDKDGNRVDAKDPKRHTLAVAAGGSIPAEEARRLGLVGDEGAEGSSQDESAASPGSGGDAAAGGAIDAKAESARVQGKAAKKPKK